MHWISVWSRTTACRTLRRGKHRLLLWPGQEADGSMESTTPSKLSTRDEMGRLEKVSGDCWRRDIDYLCTPSLWKSTSEAIYLNQTGSTLWLFVGWKRFMPYAHFLSRRKAHSNSMAGQHRQKLRNQIIYFCTLTYPGSISLSYSVSQYVPLCCL